MTTKAEKAALPEPEAAKPVLYDQSAIQAIPLTLDGFKVVHVLNPLTDERYFAFEKAAALAVKRAEKLNTNIWTPKETLWRDLCTEVRNYPPGFQPSEVDQAETLYAMNALLHVEAIAPDEEEKEGVYDPSALKTVEFRCTFADETGKSTLLRLSHSFKPDSKAQRDEFLAIETNAPNDHAIASRGTTSKQEQLATLGGKLLAGTAVFFNDEWVQGGYVGDVPAWHLAKTTESFFARQISKMGRSFEA